MLRIIRSTSMALALVALTVGTALADISSFSITNATLVNPGQILVEGTITCPVTEVFFLDVTARQPANGKNATTGFGGTSTIQCTGMPQDWSVQVVGPSQGPFKSGRTFIEARAFTSGAGPQETDQDAVIVNLH